MKPALRAAVRFIRATSSSFLAQTRPPLPEGMALQEGKGAWAAATGGDGFAGAGTGASSAVCVGAGAASRGRGGASTRVPPAAVCTGASFAGSSSAGELRRA
jgi:hypothetical protein